MRYYEKEITRLRNMKASRAYKRRHKGVCVDCGTETRLNSRNENKTSERCVRCSQIERWSKKRNLGARANELRDVIGENTVSYTYIANALGVSTGGASGLLNYYVKSGLLERVARGRYRIIKD